MYPILLSVLLYHDFSQNVKYIFVQKGRSFSSAFLFLFSGSRMENYPQSADWKEYDCFALRGSTMCPAIIRLQLIRGINR